MAKELSEETVGEIMKEYADRGLHIGVDLASPGSDQTVVTTWVRAEYHRAREKELLEANNTYLERARRAEARVKELEASASTVMPSLTRLIDERIRVAILRIERQPRR